MVNVGPLTIAEVYDRGYRPGWLADDEWRRQLAALDPADIAWFHESWHLAGGAPPAQPAPDWLTYDRIR